MCEGDTEECNTVISRDDSYVYVKTSSLKTYDKHLGFLKLQDFRETARSDAMKGLNIRNMKGDLKYEICLNSKMVNSLFRYLY